MIIPFDIKHRDKIENGEYKVETYSGCPVIIYRWDYKDKYNTPILGSYIFEDGYEYAGGWDINGKFEAEASDFDLVLITDEEEPLTPLAELLSTYLKNDFEYFATKKWDEKKWNEVMNTQATELQRVAYLEKQKESLHISETCKENADSFTDEQKEQKPVECEDCAMFLGGKCERPGGICKKEQKSLTEQEFCDYNKALHKFKVFATKQAKGHNICYIKDVEWDNFCVGIFSYFNEKQKPVDYEAELKKCKDNPLYFYDKYVSIKQKPAEWSDEDKKMLNELITIMDGGIVTSGTYLSEYAAWLKSLRPVKQEWSEEDEEMIERLIRHTQKEFDELCNDRYGHQEIISDLKESCRERMNWLEKLKSLCPQPKRDGGDDYNKGYINGRADTLKEFADMSSWKPSEEQMEALRRAVNKLAKSDVADSVRLSIMYDNFKKLM